MLKSIIDFFRRLLGLDKDEDLLDEAPRPEGAETREAEEEVEEEGEPEPDPEPEPEGDEPESDSDDEPEAEGDADAAPEEKDPDVTAPDGFVPSFTKPETDDEPETETETEDDDPGIAYVGAWCGRSSLSNPDSHVSFCKDVGINRLDIIVNDHSGQRSPMPFDTYEVDKIIRLAQTALAEGIQVHLMSWIMPHEDYIKAARESLELIVEKTGARSVMWDCEEPWTLAKNHMGYQSAADLVGHEFRDFPVPLGITGIGYTPTSKFGPLAAVSHYLTPQCYSTNTSGIKPETAVAKFTKRYADRYGEEKRMVPGLAAYRQSGVAGHTVTSAMSTALAGAQSLPHIDTVVYWSLASIMRDKKVTEFIRSIEKVNPKPKAIA